MTAADVWALELIQFHAWSGYYDEEESFDIVAEEVYESEVVDEERLRKMVRLEFRIKRAAEKKWPKQTSCDRLDAAFTSLHTRGILTRHRCGLTMQDGLDVVHDLYKGAGGKKFKFEGYCFYHIQDMEGAIQGTGYLLLAFGHFPSSAFETAAIGEVVRIVCEQAGLEVEWDGTAETRLQLNNFDWQRRSPK